MISQVERTDNPGQYVEPGGGMELVGNLEHFGWQRSLQASSLRYA